jgi:protein ImuB
MKRVLSIWLPQLAIERWAKSSDDPPDAPIVLTVEGAHGPVIHAVTRAAAERGARAGGRLTDARALDPALVAIPADSAGDKVLIDRLARWAGRWSPLVELDGEDALRLDVSGVAHLFGGEQGLIEDVRRRFGRLGLTVHMAVAPTAAAAWALARYSLCLLGEGGSSGRLRKGEEGSTSPDLTSFGHPLPWERDLASLHVAALRLDPDTIRTLERLGLKTIAALIDVPRLALARRFRGAENVVDALDRMFGRKPEPLTAAPTDPPPRALLKLEEPATHPEAAAQALDRLIPDLVRQLQERHLGVRRLALTGYRVDGSVAVASVATAIPSREPKHLQRLLADRVAALNPEFGFDAFALVADWTEESSAAQDSLVEEPSGTREMARLVDRLTVKLGPRAVRRPQRHESYLPERASGWEAAVTSSPAFAGEEDRRGRWRDRSTTLRVVPLPTKSWGGCKPHRLLDRPEAIDVIYATPEGMPRRFVWRRAVHDIARVEGPERIAPEWWRQPSSARLRDYYRVEDAAGRRYWIYREGLIGDGRGGVPHWFIHGLFG